MGCITRTSWLVGWLGVVLLGCGSQVVVEGSSSGGGGSVATGSSGGTTGATSGAGGNQAFREAYGFLNCAADGDNLLLEIPREPWDGCVPPADASLDSLIVLGVQNWSGEAGTWVFHVETASGLAGGVYEGDEIESGELVIDPLASDGTLTGIRWTADGKKGQAVVATCSAVTCN